MVIIDLPQKVGVLAFYYWPSIVPEDSSLGSRVVAGDGPGPIDIAPPTPFTLTLEDDFTFDFGTAISDWLSPSPDYDFAPPFGPIDVLDLVQLVKCGLP